MKTVFLLLLVTLGTTASFASSPQNLPQNKITESQAKALVIAALTPRQRKLPGLSAELGQAAADPGEAKNPSRFLFIMAVWEGLPEGSVMVGNYEVDPYTGDVFSATMECKEEKTGSSRLCRPGFALNSILRNQNIDGSKPKAHFVEISDDVRCRRSWRLPSDLCCFSPCACVSVVSFVSDNSCSFALIRG